MKRRRAFTLIELLVVIAVIAILMAILTPALGKARDQAKKVVCSGHMKGLGVAIRMYVDDSDGRTHNSPNQGLWDNTFEGGSVVIKYKPNDGNAYWGIAYHPYAPNKKVFRCPSTRRVDDWPENGWGLKYQEYFRYCSYGINSYVASRDTNGDGQVEWTRVDREFKKHDEVIVFQDHIEQKLDSADSDMFCVGSGGINLSQWRPGSSLVNTYWQGYDTVGECFRHKGTSMTCWLDGHVSGIKQSTGEDVPRRWYTGKGTL
ncbi:MAG TPA: type II secretion system protein [Sedimentisphaerales bacterium]|jgi:prepilin-type N-terminal cleavage/methylation domain-containing protein/prepilin-type processing-associated H-X9-DG protein|nr:type II secretion system protein [Sedimentisphaerales bacterium]HNU30630.1 type II secretion system protein [Sedimentisphaerales bacterium]